MERVEVAWYGMELDGELYCVVAKDVDLKQWGIDSVMPAGFMSDGMSIPKFFWRWLSPKIAPVTLSPSIVHDWLYQSHVMTRKDADAWYRDALIANGYPKLKAYLCYAGLRLFGESHW